MTETERSKLFDENCAEYIGIGITPDGIRLGSIPVPWEHTVHAFNMKTPDIYITPEDISDDEIMAEILRHKVVGCYIFAPLEDYSFISRFKDLHDIFICRGENLTDLSFLSELDECFMLYLEDAHLKCLDGILPSRRFHRIRMSWCIGLYNCIVEDVSALKAEDMRISELMVWNTRQDVDFDKWKGIGANTVRVRLIGE